MGEDGGVVKSSRLGPAMSLGLLPLVSAGGLCDELCVCVAAVLTGVGSTLAPRIEGRRGERGLNDPALVAVELVVE